MFNFLALNPINNKAQNYQAKSLNIYQLLNCKMLSKHLSYCLRNSGFSSWQYVNRTKVITLKNDLNCLQLPNYQAYLDSPDAKKSKRDKNRLVPSRIIANVLRYEQWRDS
jgi:hypothetical protein